MSQLITLTAFLYTETMQTEDVLNIPQLIGAWFVDHGIAVLLILGIAALLIYFGNKAIKRIIRQVIRSSHFYVISAEDARKRQDTLISLFQVLWKVLVMVVTFFLLFAEIFPDVNLVPIFASAGIVGVAVGFGAQSIIKDFFTGAFIIMENQYRVGDVVDINEASGTVERITIRSTVIRDTDGNVHFIPNGSVAHVINKTMGYSRINLTLGVAPDTDVDKLSALIDQIGKKIQESEEWKDKLLEPPHFLSIGAFSDTSLDIKITAKTQPSTQWAVTGELRRRLLKAFAKNGIELSHANNEA